MTNPHIHYPKRLPYIVSAMVIFLFFFFAFNFSSCRIDPEDRDPVFCQVSDFVAIPSPGNVTLDPGSSQTIQITANVTASVICEDIATSFSIAVISDNHPGVTLAGCGNQMDNNSGSCTTTVSVSTQTLPGTYHVEYLATAMLDDGGTAVDTKTVSVTVTESPDFSLSIPTSFGAGQGLSFTVTATVDRTGGHDEDILLSLDHIPLYLIYLFEPNPVNVTNPSSQLTLSPPQNSIPGEYSIELLGNDGSKERHAIFTFYILEPFYPTLNLESITIAQGQSGEVRVDANRLATFFDLVFFGAEGDIVGPGKDLIEPIFDPTPTTESYSDLTLVVGEDVPPGVYILTITASFDTMLKTVDLPVTVVE